MTTAPAGGSQSNRQKNLDPKLAAYCAASVAFLASGQKANAGTISYSGPQTITLTAGISPDYNSYTFNLTGSGPLSAYTTNVELVAETLTATILAIIDSPSGPQAVYDTAISAEAALSAGTLISAASVFDPGGGIPYLLAKTGVGGDWDGVTDQYLGLTFTAGCHTYYGWAELTFPDNSGTAATIEGWAYDYTPDEGILAGDTGQSATPEPSTLPLALLAMGSAGIAALRSRR